MAEKVIDARGRFRNDRRGDKAGAQPQPDPEAFWADLRKRLKYAATAMVKLGTTPRVPPTDRPILARNLGRMIERSLGQDHRARLGPLFAEAFGQEIGESHFKKRKRYVRLRGDDLEPESGELASGTYAAHGQEFLRLAFALKQHMTDFPEHSDDDRLHLCILRLIEGTSLDNRVGTSERHEAEQRAELQRRFDQIVERIESRVDLDGMRASAQRTPVIATSMSIEQAISDRAARALVLASILAQDRLPVIVDLDHLDGYQLALGVVERENDGDAV